MKNVDAAALKAQLNPKTDVNVDKLVKFGVLEKSSEAIPGWQVTMHTLSHDEREQMSASIPDEAIDTQMKRQEAMKIPTLVYAITKINGELFEDDKQKVTLRAQLKQSQGAVIDTLYIEYSKLILEQMEVLNQGLAKKKILKDPQSRVLWHICKTFHVLPNDPLFRKLDPLQLTWITENLILDGREQMKALGKGGKEVSSQTIDATAGFDDEFINRLKSMEDNK